MAYTRDHSKMFSSSSFATQPGTSSPTDIIVGTDGDSSVISRPNRQNATQASSSQDPKHCSPGSYEHSTDTLQYLNSNFHNEPLTLQGGSLRRPPPPAPYVPDVVDTISPPNLIASNSGTSSGSRRQQHAELPACVPSSTSSRPNHDFFHQSRNIRTRRYNQDRARDDEIPFPLSATEQLTDVWTEIDHFHAVLDAHTQAIRQQQSHSLQNGAQILQQGVHSMQHSDNILDLATNMNILMRELIERNAVLGEIQNDELSLLRGVVGSQRRDLQSLDWEVQALRHALTTDRTPRPLHPTNASHVPWNRGLENARLHLLTLPVNMRAPPTRRRALSNLTQGFAGRRQLFSEMPFGGMDMIDEFEV